jgi:hypothetical protein
VMNETIKQMLAREAVEAEQVADAEERGEVQPTPGRRARQHSGERSQVYSVRLPVDRIAELRALADKLDIAPTALLRDLVLAGINAWSRADAPAEPGPNTLPPRDLTELRLGPSRSADVAEVVSLPLRDDAALPRNTSPTGGEDRPRRATRRAQAR